MISPQEDSEGPHRILAISGTEKKSKTADLRAGCHMTFGVSTALALVDIWKHLASCPRPRTCFIFFFSNSFIYSYMCMYRYTCTTAYVRKSEANLRDSVLSFSRVRSWVLIELRVLGLVMSTFTH